MRRTPLALSWLAAVAWLLACSSFGSDDAATTTADGGGADGSPDADVAIDASGGRCASTTAGSGPPPLHPNGDLTTTCSTGTFDLATSAVNCGTCGRACPSGGCENGACATTELALLPTELLTIHGQTLGHAVFSTSNGKYEAFAVPSTSGSPIKIWPGDDLPDAGIASIKAVPTSAKGALIFFTQNYKPSFQRVTPDGTREAIVSLSIIPADGNAVAIDDTAYLFIEGASPAAGRQLRSIKYPDGQPVPLSSPQPYAAGLSLRGTVLYWGREPRLAGVPSDGAIVRYDTIKTSTAESVPVNPRGPVAADDAYVYYFDELARELRRLPEDLPPGAQPETLATWQGPETRTISISVNGDYVYAALAQATFPRTRVIVRVPRCGGEPIVVARDDANEYIRGHVVLDGRLVFAEASKVLATDP